MNALVNYSDDEDDQLSNVSSSPQREEEQPKKTADSSKPVETTVNQKQEPKQSEKQAAEKPSSQRETPQKEETKVLPSTVLRNLGDIEAIRQRRALLRPLPIEGVENWGIPPEPETPCDPEREAKVAHFLSLRESGHKLNEHLQRNKAFRNPRIYAKLVEFIELDEVGSNFPKEEFDPHGFPHEAYIDGLMEAQQRVMEERAMAQQNRSSIPFVPSAQAATPTVNVAPDQTSSSSRPNAAALAAAKANAQKVASRIVKQSSQPSSSPSSSSFTGEKRRYAGDDRWDGSNKQRR